jgi:predicted alpha/beta-hydrolase family hydrolase
VLAVRDAVQALGAVTALVTQPYRVRGGRAPGPAAKQDAAWAEVVGVLRRETARDGRPLPLVQCGRSNGARVACRTASRVGAAGVVALAFPLHPPGRPDKSRLAELDGVAVPTLVVQGVSDPFGMPPPGPRRTIVRLPGDHRLASDRPGLRAAVAEWLAAL